MNNFAAIDYTPHLLRSQDQIQQFRQRQGNRLPMYMKNIRDYVSRMPSGVWVCYWNRVPVKNIPVLVGCLCLYAVEYWSPNDYIEFNANAGMLRRIVGKPASTKNMKSYAQYCKELQNNGGAGRK